MNNGLIYRLLFPDGKSYVGKTVNMKNRMNNYKKLKCKKQPKLYGALVKYGFDSVKVDIVEYDIPIKTLNEREIYHIERVGSFHDGYNCTPGGDGILMTEEIRNKISKTLKSKNIKRSSEHIAVMKDMSNKSPEFINHMSSGKTISESTRKKLSESNKGIGKGIPLSEEHVSKMRKSMRSKYTNKYYEFISPKGEKFVVNNFRDFVEENKLHLRSVHRVITGERPHHKGWVIRKVS
jgi:group I intron endonuclease